MQQFFCKLLITIMQMLIKVIIAQFLLTEEKLIHRHNQLYHIVLKILSLYTYWNKKSRLSRYIIVTVQKTYNFWRTGLPYHFPSLFTSFDFTSYWRVGSFQITLMQEWDREDEKGGGDESFHLSWAVDVSRGKLNPALTASLLQEPVRWY